MIKALRSAAGVHMIRKGGIYNFPPDIEKQFVDAGHAQFIENSRKETDHGATASVKTPKKNRR